MEQQQSHLMPEISIVSRLYQNIMKEQQQRVSNDFKDRRKRNVVRSLDRPPDLSNPLNKTLIPKIQIKKMEQLNSKGNLKSVSNTSPGDLSSYIQNMVIIPGMRPLLQISYDQKNHHTTTTHTNQPSIFNKVRSISNLPIENQTQQGYMISDRPNASSETSQNQSRIEEKLQTQVNKILQTNSLTSKNAATSRFNAFKTDKKILTSQDPPLPKRIDNYLSTQDFINLIRNEPEMVDEFCYLNRRPHSHVYDWEIVPFHRKNPKEYMTISSRGITCYNDGQHTYMTLMQWEHEVQLYERIKKIFFFQKFRIWKKFFTWKKMAWKGYFNKSSELVQEKLFHTDSFFRQAYLKIKVYCLEIEQFPFLDTQFSLPNSFDEYQQRDKNFRENNLEVKLGSNCKQIQHLVEDCCVNSMTKFKEIKRIVQNQNSNKIEELREEYVKQPTSFVVGDNANLEMPYTQEAAIKSHNLRLRNFIKLADYLIVSSKTKMISNSTKQLANQIRLCNDVYDNIDIMFNNAPSWLIVQVIEQQGTPGYIPNQQECLDFFSNLLSNNIQQCCQKHMQMIHMKDYIVYTQSGEINPQEIIELQNIIQTNSKFKKYNQRIQDQVLVAFNALEKHSQKLQKMLTIYHEHQNINLDSFENMDTDKIKSLLEQYKEDDIQLNLIEPQYDISILNFDCNTLKNQFKGAAAKTIKLVQEHLPKMCENRALKFIDNIQTIYDKIQNNPANLEEFCTFIDNNTQTLQILPNLSEESQTNALIIFMCQQQRILITENQTKSVGDQNNSMSTLRKRSDMIQQNLDKLYDIFKDELKKVIPKFQDSMQAIENELNQSSVNKKDAVIESVYEFLSQIKVKMEDQDKLQTNIRKYQTYLQVFDEESEIIFTEYSRIRKEYELYDKLWHGRLEWKQCQKKWLTQQFLALNIEEMSQMIDRLYKMSNYCVREIENPDVAIFYKREIEEFKGLFLSLKSIRDPNIGDKQWDAIRLIIKSDKDINFQELGIDPETLFTNISNEKYDLNYLIQINLHKHSKELKEVAFQAYKENDLAIQVQEVDDFLKNAKFILKPYDKEGEVRKDGKSEFFILGDNDDIISKTDDMFLITSNMLQSKYASTVKEKADKHLQILKYTQQLLDEWILFQQQWLYIFPILSSSLVQKILNKEFQFFNNCDIKYRKIMKTVRDYNRLQRYGEDFKQKTHLIFFKQSNKIFEEIRKALDEFLEKKRENFHRFYFLSNEELLEIMSKVKQPLQILPYIRKLFGNIESLDIDLKDNILAIVSREGEHFKLRQCYFRGDEIEDWLKSLEEAMQGSLQYSIKKCLTDYEKEETQIQEWVILVCDAINFTRFTEDYLNPELEQDLGEWLQVRTTLLGDLIGVMKQHLGAIQRMQMINLVTMNVYYRDVAKELNDNNANLTDFSWIKNMRIYQNANQEQVLLKCVYAQFKYGYEYMGPFNKLIQTPSNDRCWIMMTQALNQNMGVNPIGPPGSGKTEICKDLANYMGKFCIVFNCSEQMNPFLMQRIFIGICQSGFFLILEEFNRIQEEIISVIAQQFQVIRQALLTPTEGFSFFNKQLTIDDHFGLFVTFNPQQAGRYQIPENMIQQLQTVSLVSPPLTLICEILYSTQGFKTAKILAQITSKFFNICSIQLSTEVYYDYSLKTIKYIIQCAAKKLKDDIPEETIIVDAIRSTLSPKYKEKDLVIFNQIITDFFPDKVYVPTNLLKFSIQKIFYVNLSPLQIAVQNILKQNQLVVTRQFVQKSIQLNELINRVQGIIVIGASMCGKTTLINTLRDSCNVMAKEGQSKKVQSVTIHPRSITQSNLYGYYNADTYQDGLVSQFIRKYTKDDSDDLKWIIFDGPLDPIWFENMNTVLDDSQILTLQNGERLKIRPELKLIFEVQNLANSSPSAIYRCSIINIEQGVIEYEDMVRAYLDANLKGYITQEQIDHIKKWIVIASAKGFPYIERICKTIIPLRFSHMAMQIAKIAKVIIQSEKNLEVLEERGPTFTRKTLERLVMFSYYWALNTMIQTESITRFERQMSDIFPSEIYDIRIPQLFYQLSPNENEFQPWENLIQTFEYKNETRYFDIYIKTKENVSVSWLIEKFMLGLIPLYITGQPGTGKTFIITKQLQKLKNSDLIQCSQMNFYNSTRSDEIQNLIEDKLGVQRKKDYLIMSPPQGKKLVIFIDDASLPCKDQYDVQEAIEFLRQVQDQRGFYDRENFTWKQIDQTVLLIATQAGRGSDLPERFLRFFNIINLNRTAENCLYSIFQPILEGFLTSNPFEQVVKNLAVKGDPVNATIAIFQELQQNMLPTMDRSHYQFTLRDITRVFQGILKIEPPTVNDVDTFIRLWYHEIARVFQDKLTTTREKEWFEETVHKIVYTHYSQILEKHQLFGTSDSPHIYCDYTQRLEKNNYTYVNDLQKLQQYIMNFISNKHNIFLFKEVIQHLTHITRILSLDQGHLLFIGLAGSGKKTLVKLACSIEKIKYKKMNFEQKKTRNEFRMDLLELMKQTAFSQESVCLLLGEDMNIQESFWEDICNVLAQGEIHGYLGKDEVDQISEQIREESLKEAGKDEIQPYDYFIKKIKNNLHFAITMNQSQQLRMKIRQFPQLISEFSIDWIHQWPEEAFSQIGRRILNKMQDLDGDKKEKYIQISVKIHTHFDEIILKQQQMHNWIIYNPPRNYIDLLESYITSFDKTLNNHKQAQKKLEKGILKLQDLSALTEDLKSVQQMQGPILDQLTFQLLEGQKENTASKIELAKTKKDIEKEEKEVSQHEKKMETKQLEILEFYEQELRTFRNSALSIDFNTEMYYKIKQNLNNTNIKMTFECVMILLKEPLTDDNIKKNITVWETFQKKIKNLAFEAIDPEAFIKIKQIIQNEPTFLPQNVENQQCKIICEWIFAYYHLHIKYLETSQWRAQLNKWQQEFERDFSTYNKKKYTIIHLNQKIKEVEVKCFEIQQEVTHLGRQREDNQIKNKKLMELMDVLGNEAVKWNTQIDEIQSKMPFVEGDSFLFSACVIYLGPVYSQFRNDVLTYWKNLLQESRLAFNQQFTLSSFQFNPIEFLSKQYDGLHDQDTLDSAAIALSSRCYPLFIDPQQQALSWLQKTYGQKLKIIDIGSENLVAEIEECLKNEFAILISNVDVSLNHQLDPILLVPPHIEVVYDGSDKWFLELGQSKISLKKERLDFFMISRLNQPNFISAVYTKTSVINFTLSDQGIKEIFLNEILNIEYQKIHDTCLQTQQSIQSNYNQLIINEEQVLFLILEDDPRGDIQENHQLIEQLIQIKVQDKSIEEAIEQGQNLIKKTQTVKKNNQRVADKMAVIYSLTQDLQYLHPLYQYSLNYIIKQICNFYQKQLTPWQVEQNSIHQKEQEFIELCKTNSALKYQLQKEGVKPPHDMFDLCMSQSELDERAEDLSNKLQMFIFHNINRGVLRKHQRAFYFLFAAKIEIFRGQISQKEWNYLVQNMEDSKKIQILPVRGDEEEEEEYDSELITLQAQSNQQLTHTESDISSPSSPFLKKLGHNNLKLLEGFSQVSNKFQSIIYSFQKKGKEWSEYLKQPNLFDNLLPFNFEKILTVFQKLMLVKCLKQDRFIYAIDSYVKQILGCQYLDLEDETIEEILEYTNAQTPALFIISQGNDPIRGLIDILNKSKDKYTIISLGQGQHKLAMESLQAARTTGKWILIQNLHLSSSLEELDDQITQIIQNLDKKNDQKLKLFLTTEVCTQIPKNIIQNSLKINSQAPQNIRSNMVRSVIDTQTQGDNDPYFFKLYYSLIFMHSVVQLRGEYGSIAWNNTYQFNQNDLKCSVRILQDELTLNPTCPNIKGLRYLFGEVVYGGRVTDENDKFTLQSLINKFFNDQILSGGGSYVIPITQNYQELQEHIQQQPIFDIPDIYGFDEFSESTHLAKQNQQTIIHIQSLTGNLNPPPVQDKESTVLEILSNLEKRIPNVLQRSEEPKKEKKKITVKPNQQSSQDKDNQPKKGFKTPKRRKYRAQDPKYIKFFLKEEVFDKKESQKAKVAKPKGSYPDQFDLCLMQECERYNSLLKLIRKTVQNLINSVRGHTVMSLENELLFESFYQNQVPSIWREMIDGESLGIWFDKLIEKVEFFVQWLDEPPNCFWLGAFFQPHSFLTSISQNYSRKYAISIDQIHLNLIIKYTFLDEKYIDSPPDNGIYISRLYGQCCHFDGSEKIQEGIPNQKFCKVPIIHFQPDENNFNLNRIIKDIDTKKIMIPLYKNTQRKGIYSSSGMNSNFITKIEIPSLESQSDWTLKGAAIFCDV